MNGLKFPSNDWEIKPLSSAMENVSLMTIK